MNSLGDGTTRIQERLVRAVTPDGKGVVEVWAAELDGETIFSGTSTYGSAVLEVVRTRNEETMLKWCRQCMVNAMRRRAL